MTDNSGFVESFCWAHFETVWGAGMRKSHKSHKLFRKQQSSILHLKYRSLADRVLGMSTLTAKIDPKSTSVKLLGQTAVPLSMDCLLNCVPLALCSGLANYLQFSSVRLSPNQQARPAPETQLNASTGD